jgi:hypothetical protein
MKLVALVATAALAAAPSVFAADVLKADVPFPFQVEGKTLPAGAYQFSIEVMSNVVDVHGGSPPDAALAPILTRMAARPHPGPSEHAHIVFDKVGSTYTLSELWEPGADGFLVHITKGPHEHHVIHVTK